MQDNSFIKLKVLLLKQANAYLKVIAHRQKKSRNEVFKLHMTMVAHVDSSSGSTFV